MNELAISANTVQEHLRAAFDKVGVGNRRELVAVLMGQRSP
jgi:DNA-binding CsgD family transcriptional regulator